MPIVAMLPDDMAEAFESFKLAIVRRHASNWNDANKDEVLRALQALMYRVTGLDPQETRLATPTFVGREEPPCQQITAALAQGDKPCPPK